MTDENTLENELEPVDTEQQDEAEVIDQPEGETTEAEDGEKVVEPWMETEDDQADDGSSKETDADKAAKGTLKALLAAKKRNKERESALAEELEQARRELERVKAQSFDKPISTSTRPKEWDFETDEEYQAALDKWEDERLDAKIETREQAKLRIESERRARKEVEEGYENHTTRAEEMLKLSGIAPERYVKASQRFKDAIEAVRPGAGEGVAKFLLSKLGEGSEKVEYYFGNNETPINKLQSLLVKDPTGIEAAFYLGGERDRLLGLQTKQKTSKAPPPAPDVTNGRVAINSASDYKKKYDSAKSMQEMVDARRAARQAGIDVSKW